MYTYIHIKIFPKLSCFNLNCLTGRQAQQQKKPNITVFIIYLLSWVTESFHFLLHVQSSVLAMKQGL